MAKIVIDTNEFIDILKLSKEEVSKYLKTIIENISYFIFPQQIIDETNRNIPKAYKHYVNDMENKYQPYNIKTCQLLNDDTLTEKLKKINKKLGEAKKRDIKVFNENAKLVLDMLNNLDSSKILPSTTNILEKASHRKLCGNPPSSNKRIGDEIIWETLMEWAEDDLVFVTSDHTFFDNEEFLNIEYNKKHKNLLGVYNKLADAIDYLGLNSQGLIEIEQKEQELAKYAAERLTNGYTSLLQAFSKISILQSKLQENNYFTDYFNYKPLQELATKINSLKLPVNDFIGNPFPQVTKAQEVLSQIKPITDLTKQ